MKNPRLLYVSCHSVLEYDELRMFRDEGISFFCDGAYINPENPHVDIRPPLTGCYLVNAHSQYHSMCGQNAKVGLPVEWHSKTFTKEFLDQFDIIIIMHVPDWISKNWEVLRGRNVIWRTIGQSTPHVENQLKKCREEGLKIVRYSPMERTIPGYIGEDALIRFGKYKEDFKPWIGDINQVISLGQHTKARGWFCNHDIFEAATAGLQTKLYGKGNEEELTYDQLPEVLSHNRVFFYTGTRPASYTLGFIEAAMAGIPIVSIGPQSFIFENHDYFEVPLLLEKYRSGFFSDEVSQLRKDIETLLNDKYMADFTSHKALKMAHEEFDAEKIRKEWIRFFDSL